MIERLIIQQDITNIFLVSVDEYVDLEKPFPKKTPHFISFLYQIDRLLSKCNPSTLESKNLGDLSASESNKLKRDKAKLNKLSLNEYLTHIETETISSAIVLNTAENSLKDEIINKTPLSIFSVFLGAERQVSSPLTGILEFISGSKTITSGIQIEKPKREKNKIVFSSTTSIEPPSLCRTLETCLNKTSVFLERNINNHKQQLELYNQVDYPEIESKHVDHSITFYQNISLITHFALRVAKRIFEKFSITEQWILLLGKNKNSSNLNKSLSTYRKIVPPKDQFWADPFMVEYQNKHYLFLEVFPYERDLGHLSCMEILEDGSHTEPVMILERPYHLSYPNVFEYQNEYYMIPESGDNGTIELYKSTNFPYEWKFEYNLMSNIRAYDSTLHFHNGLWWLFAAVSENEMCPTTEELYLFYSDSPISSNWTPHANNPVVSDAASARPAGKIFKDGNTIIRPSQNCAGSYGAGLNLCEVLTLDKNTYEEKIIDSFKPDWDKDLSGLHTLNSNNTFSVSDAILKRGKRN